MPPPPYPHTYHSDTVTGAKPVQLAEQFDRRAAKAFKRVRSTPSSLRRRVR